MSSNFTVIYVACVLYPAPLRDLLMRLVLTDLYQARWTDMIHDEWTRHVLKQRSDLMAEDLERTRSLMNAHVRDSLVTGFEHLIPSFELPDADDRHGVAAVLWCPLGHARKPIPPAPATELRNPFRRETRPCACASW
jgi:hypothetical protein